MGILALAGMVSGAGESLGKATSQMAGFIGTSALQEQREKMELRRMELMEANYSAREQRGYAHSEQLAKDAQANARGMHQETIAHAERTQDKAFQHADETLEKTQGFTQGENDKTREQHRADQAQARLIAERTLANAEAGTENTREHQEATERIARAQLAAAKAEATLMPLADGSLYRVDGQGKVLGKAMDPDTGKPLQGTKDLPATTKLLVEVNKVMIQQKGEQLKNTSLLPEERTAINSEMTRLKGDIETLLGRAPVKSGSTQIVDPAATIQAPDTVTAKSGPATPAPGAEDYLAQKRQEAEQRAAALKGATQQEGQAAMDAERPGAIASTAPAPTETQPAAPPTSPQVAKMERQAPRRMQQPGEASEPSGLIAAVKPPPASIHAATLPHELPRTNAPYAMTKKPPLQEPDMIDPNGPPDPFVSDQPANVPRELQRTAPPSGVIATTRPPMAEPDIIDPTIEPETKSPKASNPKGQSLTLTDLQSVLTTGQKEAIANMQRRIRSSGIGEKPAATGQLEDLLLKVLGPIYRRNGESPAATANGVNQMMNELVPEKMAHQ